MQAVRFRGTRLGFEVDSGDLGYAVKICGMQRRFEVRSRNLAHAVRFQDTRLGFVVGSGDLGYAVSITITIISTICENVLNN